MAEYPAGARVAFNADHKDGPWRFKRTLGADELPCLSAAGFSPSVPAATPAVHLSSDPGTPYFGLALVVLLLLVYFVPTLVSGARGCKAHGGIVVVNLFLGWTFIGWVVALAWAASGEQRPKPLPAEVS